MATTPRSSNDNDALQRILRQLDVIQNGLPQTAARPWIEDPTRNVLALVTAEKTRNDDLREAEAKRLDERFKFETKAQRRELKAMRRELGAQALAEQRRVDALLAAAAAERALERTRTELTATALADRVEAAQKALATTAGAGIQRGETRQLSQTLLAGLSALAGAVGTYLALHR